MKIYKHKKTGVRVQFIETNSKDCQYKAIGADGSFPAWAIEDSQDWQIIEDILTSDHKELPLLSFNDIIKLSRQNGHYRDFTTTDLIIYLRDKLLLEKDKVSVDQSCSAHDVNVAIFRAKFSIMANPTTYKPPKTPFDILEEFTNRIFQYLYHK